MKIIKTHKNPVLEFYSTKGLKVLALQKIVYIESIEKGSIIYLKNLQKVQTGYILKAYANVLPEPYYFRCHNSFIVNCQYVDCFCKNKILLLNNMKLPLSRRRRNKFEENLIKFEQKL